MNNNQLQHLMGVIDVALGSNDPITRPQAQNYLIHYRDSNTSQFFLQCSQIIASNAFNNQQRQKAGTVASRLINMRINDTDKFYWDEIDPKTKNQIKQNCLSILINTPSDVMKAAASILAGIASIELPRDQWSEIVDTLADNCTNQDSSIQSASITTMGYICEKIKSIGKTINNRLSQLILGSIILSARQGGKFMHISIKALEDSMQFLSNLMQESKYREPVFEVFIENFSKGIEPEETYNALYEFVKTCSPFLSSYSKALTDLAQMHLDKKDSVEITLNLTLWQIIGTDYYEKVLNARERVGQSPIMQPNLLQSVSQQMLPLIMKLLIITDKQDQQSVEQPIKVAALRALQAFVKVCDVSVVDTITRSVSNILHSPDPNLQQASVPLFSTICEYPDIDYNRSVFTNGFDHLFNLIQVPHQIVVRNSLSGFVRLSEMLPEVFLNHSNLEYIIDKLIQYMNVRQEEVRYNSVQIISNMTEGLKENPNQICDNPNILLTKIVQFYSQNMEQLHKQKSQVNQRIIAIILNIVMTSNKKQIMIHLIEFMMEEYNKIISSNLENIPYLIEQVICVLHTSILAHKNAVPSTDLMAKLCTLIDFHINRFGIEQEGLSLLGAMATTFQKSFQVRAQKYWQSVVKKGLTMVNEIATFKAALNCVGDFARMMESIFFNYAAQVMQQLMLYIQENLDREVKLSIISCMGDLLLSMHEYSSNFIDQIINISDLSFSAVYQLTSSSQDMEYVEQLKSNLIEMYSCVVFSVNSKKMNRSLYDHFGNLATFIVRTCNKNLHPTVQYLKNCLYLLHDSAAFYWQSFNGSGQQKIRQILKSNEVGELLALIQKFKDRPEIRQLLDFIHSRTNM